MPQELDFISCFSVAENIYLGEEQLGIAKLIDYKRLYKEAETLLKELNIDLPVKEQAGHLNVSQQQMMIIARILSKDAKIIIMDEPTARLGHDEIVHLLEYVNYLKSIGKTIVIFNHWEEVFEICDTVTVLRDGETIATMPVTEISNNELVHLMVNREVNEKLLPETGHSIGNTMLKVEHLNKKNLLNDVGFEVRSGEILGMFGMVGSGRTEAIRALLGIDKCDHVDIYLDGKSVKFKNNREAMRRGVVLVPEERRKQGVILSLPISTNITIGQMRPYERLGLINEKKEKQKVKEVIDKVGVVCGSSAQKVGELSGGNQQKVVFAKHIDANMKVFILDEPTRGVDVGAKRQIYDIVENLAAAGMAVMMISSEIPELQLICDRICIMKFGKIVKELSRSECLDADTILHTQWRISR